MSNQPHIIVVGGGFGGLNVVKALQDAPVQITLVDRHNYHLFRPLLYQVAMAGLSPADIASPLRVIFKRNKNVRTILADVTDIDTEQRQVILATGEQLAYDKLVVATGAVYDYFGNDAWGKYAPSLETVESALEIRRRVLAAYEAAELDPDPIQRQAWMTFVIIGGGPTGVELAGAIGEMANRTLHENFRNIDPANTKILLVEALDRLLVSFPTDLSDKARQALEKLGVTVRTNTKVTEIADTHITVQTGDRIEQIPCHTIMWAAGVKANALGQVLHQRAGVDIDRKGRIKVLPNLTLPNHPEIFAIGDITYFEQDGKPLAGLAPVAIQQGQHAAKQILRQLNGQPIQPFRYWDKGIMATIGRAAAVADIKHIHLSGYIAWLAWLFIHIIQLIGFRNRLSVLSQWVWNYFTYSRSVRLIVGRNADVVASQPRTEQIIGEINPQTKVFPLQDDVHADGVHADGVHKDGDYDEQTRQSESSANPAD
jgi:NADH dehydrogenase